MSDNETLYVTDAELIRRLGVGEKTARVAIVAMEREPGFPCKDPLFKKRYWPAVRAFLDRRSGLSMEPLSVIDEGDNLNAPTERGRRPRNRVAQT